MFVCGIYMKVSFKSAVEEHYFHIEERDFVVGKGTGKLDTECRSGTLKSLSLCSLCVQRTNILSM